MRRSAQAVQSSKLQQAILYVGAFYCLAQTAPAQAVTQPATQQVAAPAATNSAPAQEVAQPVAKGAASSAPTAAAPAAARKILISIPDRKLALIENGRAVKVYPIAVGTRATPTPAGEFKIINRLTHPTWFGGDAPVPPGPENPLGTRWMGLSKKGYGIHGTNAPRSIGKRASHGCIRMAQADLEELFEMIRVGDVVVLAGQRTAEVAAVFGAPQIPAAPAAQPVAAPAPLVVAAALPIGN
jgi:lipoprotein-anchoring transpeptidase ErfK/SrfK